MTMTEVNDMMIDTSTTNNSVQKKNSITGKVEDLISKGDEITLEDLAPDGGWGWMIALAMILIMFTTIGPISSFTIIFGDFFEDSGQAGFASSLSNSVFMITYSIASLLTNTLLKRYSTRPVGIVGALFFALPNIVIAFVRNIYEMAFICFIQGFGLGLIFTITNTVFNSYFVKKRAKVMYASQVIIGLGGIIFPTLCEKMLPIYGFRGTAAIIGALSLHSIVGMIMMHPVEWHAKKLKDVRVEKAREKEQNISQELALLNRRSTIDVVHLPIKTKWNSLCSLKEGRSSEMPLLIETVKASVQRVASVPVIENHGKAKSGPMWENLSRRTSAISAPSLVNLANRTTCILSDIRLFYLEKKYKKQDKEIQKKEEAQDIEKEQKITGYKTILRELVDISLVKNFCFINFFFGVSFVCSSDFGFSFLLPLMITDAGYPKNYAALSVTISGIAELASKILLSVFTLIINIKSKYIFFAATILMGFARIGFLLCEHTLKGALITIALIGAVRSWLLVPQPLVIIEDLNIEKFASAYGINSVISSLVTIIFGAIVGIIKDWTDFRKWRKQRAQGANTMDHQWE
ncbi:Monocarboxylate transporter 9 [Trachymyrmex septentrionalis]|uniref:Monocarboxylate transporter 9 n=1 Tax=Trachymyrmex septentrionalis TaxID=34720 RepID=A0A195FRD0_9HYME|nr:Monocarboxylate transporter 9 [Trachymyrmex septentrionalis]